MNMYNLHKPGLAGLTQNQNRWYCILSDDDVRQIHSITRIFPCITEHTGTGIIKGYQWHLPYSYVVYNEPRERKLLQAIQDTTRRRRAAPPAALTASGPSSASASAGSLSLRVSGPRAKGHWRSTERLLLLRHAAGCTGAAMAKGAVQQSTVLVT